MDLWLLTENFEARSRPRDSNSKRRIICGLARRERRYEKKSFDSPTLSRAAEWSVYLVGKENRSCLFSNASRSRKQLIYFCGNELFFFFFPRLFPSLFPRVSAPRRLLTFQNPSNSTLKRILVTASALRVAEEKLPPPERHATLKKQKQTFQLQLNSINIKNKRKLIN